MVGFRIHQPITIQTVADDVDEDDDDDNDGIIDTNDADARRSPCLDIRFFDRL